MGDDRRNIDMTTTTRLLLWSASLVAYGVSAASLGPVERADASDIVFELFTRQNPTEPQLLKLDDPKGVLASNFDPNLPTRFFAHGWNADANSGYSTRNAYLQKEECNFISVDWSTLSAGINYPYIAVVNVPKAGNHVGAFIDLLISVASAPLDSFHLIGFSLGAHVIGQAGASIRAGKVPRITGLDPAGPGFTTDDGSIRLDREDALFLDVIQTNSGNLLENGLGYGAPIGHIDFFPNGGEFQPGCLLPLGFESVLGFNGRLPSDSLNNPRGGCSHGRAVSYFAESINSAAGFVATACESWQAYQNGTCAGNEQLLMGEPTPTTATGVFYLATNSRSPYAQ